MKNNHLIEAARGTGLSENEARVYFGLLSLGPATVLQVARTSELKRTTVYSVLDSLKNKGLVRTELYGFKKKFVAENPEALKKIVEEKNEELHELMPEFLALYNLHGGESFIKYYEGLESIKGVYEKLIKDIRPHEDYLVMANQDSWLGLDKEYFLAFLYRRAKLPIKIRMLFQDTPLAHEWKKIEKNFNSKVKILPKSTGLKTNLVVTPQRVLIHQLTPPLIGIVIENKSVIQMHREMYEIIWESITE